MSTEDRLPTIAVTVTHAAFDPARRRHLATMEREFGLHPHRLPEGVTRYTVTRDVDRSGVWPVARKALAAPLAKASHLLVLSDDMVPCPGEGPAGAEFWDALRRAVAEVPDKPVSLMTMGDAPKRAVDKGLRWVRGRDALWAGSLVWPVAMLEDLQRFLRGWVEPVIEGHVDAPKLHDDHRFAIYCRAIGVEAWTPAPLLLSHLAELPSLLGHPSAIGGKARTAHHLAGVSPMPAARDVAWGGATQSRGRPWGTPVALPSAAYLGGPTRRACVRVGARLARSPWRSLLPQYPGERTALTWPIPPQEEKR